MAVKIGDEVAFTVTILKVLDNAGCNWQNQLRIVRPFILQISLRFL